MPPAGSFLGGGMPCSRMMLSTKSRCSCGIISSRSSVFPSTKEAGIRRSTPNGLSPTRSRIQRISLSSSSGSIPAAPSTPMPPAFETAAITSFVWANATIGNSHPYSSHSRVCSGFLVMASPPWRHPTRADEGLPPSNPVWRSPKRAIYIELPWSQACRAIFAAIQLSRVERGGPVPAHPHPPSVRRSRRSVVEPAEALRRCLDRCGADSFSGGRSVVDRFLGEGGKKRVYLS